MSKSPSAFHLATTSRPALPPGFIIRHLVLPLVLAIIAGVLLMHAGGDRRLADVIYGMEGGQWALRDHWLTRGVIHRGGKWASVLAGLGVLFLCVHAFRHEAWKHLRLPLLYLLLAAALGSTAVSLLKSITHVDCPWDLLRYGGTRAMPTSLFAAQPPGTPSGACFPAGHASAGYAWVALYFAALLGCRRWRWHGLAIGLGSGLLFGAGQQLRGAHFLSHDLGSLAVCWSLSLALYCVFVWRTGCAPTQLPSEPAEANA